ncbi:alkaline phosphatase D [Pseudomonas sp. ok272]|uniref:alkaline phosphatase D family protein n=1 Tax=unclassified Pseudomonas TaxID=196821 RepID=UPI0008C38163|nr:MULTISPECIES: alkaline phosphatase D family protein [unclassified Pseudomonas]SEM86091.1 alkaline phosphatase D [Pseudomonas sp. ok272]SFM77965.1 alkaline phosphatase D [Pseudomonas sp. ok602]
MHTPTVGPIIGHTTLDQVRIFLRGDWQKNTPVYAGIRYRRAGTTPWSDGKFVELTALRDMTGVITLEHLSSDTHYEYQAGWFSSPVAPSAPHPPTRPWPAPVYSFRTASRQTTTPRAYIVGSCRYLRMTLGVATLPAKGDRIFAAIHRLAQATSPPASALVMTGDQVYVDDLNIFGPDLEYKAITKKYQAAFSQPNIRALMAGTSTYMILDDHEIEDNWPAKAGNQGAALYRNAMAAYDIYQASHGPGHERLADGQLSRELKHYWYQFAHGDIAWFVTDSRTRRNLSAGDRRILDAEQEHALLEWLVDSPARVKLVVTSVLFFPDCARNDHDAWQAFPAQRRRILETLRAHKLKNVVFVSGDIHGSLTSCLRHRQDPDFELHTIVSSPLCNSALLPYAKTSTFILDQPLDGDYHHELTSKVISQDNFAHLVIDTQKIRVTFHDVAGKALQAVDIPLR